MATLPPYPAAVSPLADAEITDRRWAGPRSLRQLAYALQRETLAGPEDVAIATSKILEAVAVNATYESLDELVATIRAIGAYLQRVQPREQAVGNVIRRALHQLREDAIEEGIISQRAAEESAAAANAASLAASPAASGSSYFDGQHAPSKRGRPSLDHFRPGSTFSISDLVAAGVGAGSSNASAATTPAPSQSHTGGLASSIGQLSLSSVKEDDSTSKGYAGGSSNGDDDSDEGEGSVSQLSGILMGVAEKLIEDIAMAPQEIASKCASHHVHSGEFILTIGHDKTVEHFIKTAGKQRQFTVFVAESAPTLDGHKMAVALSAAKVETILVPDASISALLPRVTKIIVGARLILADGGLLVAPGVRLLTELARLHHCHVYVLAGTYKLCPDPAWVSAGTWLHSKRFGQGEDDIQARSPNTSSSTDLASVSRALEGPQKDVIAATFQASDLDATHTASKSIPERLVANPTVEYLGPEGYDLLMTNTGEHAVSLVHLLVAQNYDRQDLIL